MNDQLYVPAALFRRTRLSGPQQRSGCYGEQKHFYLCRESIPDSPVILLTALRYMIRKQVALFGHCKGIGCFFFNHNGTLNETSKKQVPTISLVATVNTLLILICFRNKSKNPRTYRVLAHSFPCSSLGLCCWSCPLHGLLRSRALLIGRTTC